MAAERRSWIRPPRPRAIRAGVSVLMFAGAVLFGTLATAGPAQADPPPLFSASSPPQFGDFHPGDQAQSMAFTITDKGEPAGATISASIAMTPADDFTVA